MRWLIIMMTATGDLKRDRAQPGAVEMTQPRESDSLWMNARSEVWGESPGMGPWGFNSPLSHQPEAKRFASGYFKMKSPARGGAVLRYAAAGYPRRAHRARGFSPAPIPCLTSGFSAAAWRR